MQPEDPTASAPSRCLVSVCGEVSITARDGQPRPVKGRQPQEVLAYLALERRPVLRDELAGLLWDEDALPDHWPGAVRGVLSKVRSALQSNGLPATALIAEGGVVFLQIPGGWETDLDRAGADLDRAEAALGAGGLEEAIAASRAAGVAVAGHALPSADGAWARRLTERVDALRSRAARLYVEALLASGQPDEAVAAAAARVAVDPYDEVAHHLLIQAHLATGHRTAAQVAYDALATILADELGISPSAETIALLEIEPELAPLLTVATRTAAGVPTRDPFVGRTVELERLHHSWTSTLTEGSPQVVVIEGQTGIGKTTLATKFAEDLEAAGIDVLWGRCRADSGIAYEPVAMALRRRFDRDGDALLDRLGEDRAGLALLVPAASSGDEPGAADDPEVARAALFRDVVATISKLAERPTVWVVDDAQWASEDTTSLIEVAIDQIDRPVLLVITARNIPPAVSAWLSRLQRVLPTATFELGALSEADLLPLVAHLGPVGDVDPAVLAADLHERTGGHPFFLMEIAREARRQGGTIAEETPDAARTWIRRRAESLVPELATRLDLAAVIGVDVPLELLARCTSDDVDDVLDRLEQLVDLGFLAESDELDEFRFPHQITRDVIYEALRPSRRARLHRSVAEAMEAEAPRVGRAGALAYHWARSGPTGQDKAVHYAVAGAWEALEGSAWSLAEDLLAGVLPATDGDEVGRARVLVPLGVARHRLLRSDEARDHLEEAVALAKRHRMAPELAEAALNLVGRGGRGAANGMTDDEQAALLRDALVGLKEWPPHPDDPSDGPERRDFLVMSAQGELALALLFTDEAAERHRLVTEALARVRRQERPEPAHLARALLNARLAKGGPHQSAERLADLYEILALPPGASAEAILAVHTYAHEDRLRMGDRTGAKANLAEARRLADEHGHPFWRWATHTWSTLDQIISGDLEAAEASAHEALGFQTGDQPEAIACLGVQLVDIRSFQGRTAEVVDMLVAASEANPTIPCYEAVLTFALTEAGDLDAAEEHYRRFASTAFDLLPDDSNRFLGLAVLADAAADLGDEEGARTLASLLMPWADQPVLLNCYGGGGSYWGPTRRLLGRLASVTGDPDGAAEHFAAALAAATSFAAPLAEARVRRDAGGLLEG